MRGGGKLKRRVAETEVEESALLHLFISTSALASETTVVYLFSLFPRSILYLFGEKKLLFPSKETSHCIMRTLSSTESF